MKKDNDNAKEKHAKSNSKHQKAVALRTQWLKHNPDKKKEDWDYADAFFNASIERGQ